VSSIETAQFTVRHYNSLIDIMNKSVVLFLSAGIRLRGE
jgi:hypothetical protein